MMLKIVPDACKAMVKAINERTVLPAGHIAGLHSGEMRRYVRRNGKAALS